MVHNKFAFTSPKCLESNPPSFFRNQTAESRTKADIVSSFARAWFNVFLGPKLNPTGSAEVAYVDLFSGPGVYSDGGLSTPLFITQSVASAERFRKGVRLLFNDQSKENVQTLRNEVSQVPGIGSLHFQPRFLNESASVQLVRQLGLRVNTPKLFFLDQFGWSDVKPALLSEIFKSPKCDCLLFVRTSRLQAAITNTSATSALEELFGSTRLKTMRQTVNLHATDRQAVVLDNLKDVAAEAGATLFHAFPFRVTDQNKPKHHLIYLGRHPLPLSIIRQIMAAKSTEDEFGIPVIGYVSSPASATMLSLFAVDPIEELGDELRQVFSGKRLRVIDIYFEHQKTNSRFLLNHYQDALRRLEEKREIAMIPDSTVRPKRQGKVTVAENIEVVFTQEGDR